MFRRTRNTINTPVSFFRENSKEIVLPEQHTLTLFLGRVAFDLIRAGNGFSFAEAGSPFADQHLMGRIAREKGMSFFDRMPVDVGDTITIGSRNGVTVLDGNGKPDTKRSESVADYGFLEIMRRDELLLPEHARITFSGEPGLGTVHIANLGRSKVGTGYQITAGIPPTNIAELSAHVAAREARNAWHY